MKILQKEDGFEVVLNGRSLLSHTKEAPLFYVGVGEENIEMYRGNFKIEDYVTERIPLRNAKKEVMGDKVYYRLEDNLLLELEEKGDTILLNITSLKKEINRLWIRVGAKEKERVYGCGEQMSYFNLRGRHFPLWSSEPGVGRDKTSYITFQCDVDSQSGGDYYNTNYPQPTYVSCEGYYLHVDSTAYADFDFRHKEYHELQIWEVPKQIRIQEADTFLSLMEKMTAYFGRQPKLPEWIYKGAILGIQGGTKRAFDLVEKSIEKGIKISGIWCQDWEGKRETSFGKRLQWDWKWNEKMYPNLPEKIREYEEKGIKYLGYINPYLVNDGELYQEGREKGYFATDEKGEDYLVDFGEFYCGVVDFTNPCAYEWFKEIIKKNMIAFGLSGWMADFGEYLPTDLKLYNGKSPKIEHNHWPALWAKCNYDALKETGKLSEIIYFMRAGATGTQKYCPLLWAGDQSVDFSIHDGLASVISGALSAAMSGNGLHHSDIGGYTSLYDNVRTKELFLRWAEMAVFTPVMRTHEGNRPDTNFQYYEDEESMFEFARLTDIYVALTPYLRKLVEENAEKGIPVQRPLFLHYEEEDAAYDMQTEYLFGKDILVAPIYLEGQRNRDVYLPNDTWYHLWTGKEYGGGIIKIEAPMGEIPVFYRKDSEYKKLFQQIGNQYRKGELYEGTND